MTTTPDQPPRTPEAEPSDLLRVLQSRDEIRAYYNKIAKVYDLLTERSEDPMRKAGIDRLNPQPSESMLEIGFGTGHSLVELARRVAPDGTVYGIDLSEEMLELARALVAREGVGDRVTLWQGDATALPLDDNSVDGVFMSFTLELFDTPEIPKVLAECRRVTAPGARLAIVSISKEQPRDPMVRIYEWTHSHFPNLLDCRPIHVRRALEAAGFAIESSDLRHMWVPVEIVLGRK
jgi:demethylmenaquinone methyltransferase/2-methoxy-6-polyprenyl-1,4-benzoquinol methylase